jgi:hypothetical protein
MGGTKSGRIKHGKQQKKWTAEFKTEVVSAVLHGEVAAAELSRQHGIDDPLVIESEVGSDFTSELFQNFCQSLGS